MSFSQKLRDASPYIAVLCAAVYLYYVAAHISYSAIPDQMGPERWPEIVTAVLGFVCIVEIGRRLFVSPSGVRPTETGNDSESSTDDELLNPKQTHVPLVFGTIAATVGYLLILEHCGFVFSTTIYSACLMWLGGFRRPGYVALVAVLLSLFLSFVFMKLIFVAFPLGEGPFEKISLFVMSLVGVH
jgi:putative tricarboxylic transport membrane protein